jgi:hypothetical protein
MILARIKAGKTDASELEKLAVKTVKHSIFQLDNNNSELVPSDKVHQSAEHKSDVAKIVHILNSEKSSSGCYAISQNKTFRELAMAYYKQTKKTSSVASSHEAEEIENEKLSETFKTVGSCLHTETI